MGLINRNTRKTVYVVKSEGVAVDLLTAHVNTSCFTQLAAPATCCQTGCLAWLAMYTLLG